MPLPPRRRQPVSARGARPRLVWMMMPVPLITRRRWRWRVGSSAARADSSRVSASDSGHSASKPASPASTARRNASSASRIASTTAGRGKPRGKLPGGLAFHQFLDLGQCPQQRRVHRPGRAGIDSSRRSWNAMWMAALRSISPPIDLPLPQILMARAMPGAARTASIRALVREYAGSNVASKQMGRR